MRIPYIYYAGKLKPNSEVTLKIEPSNHILHVLRLKLGSPLILFDGTGGEYNAQIFAIDKSRVIARVEKFIDREVESPLKITLGQGISRGEKMDYTIQKAVELGVYKITPLFTEFCNVKLSGERLQKRLQHWQSIAISACEQCGRNCIPIIDYARDLPTWIPQNKSDVSLTLYHGANQILANLPKKVSTVTILVGPEGGLSDHEIEFAQRYNFIPIRFGPRILRTETAALTAISILQSKWGDMM
jgi:16S rRNA (uracil1498-N3)-methyltransferase